MEAMTHKEQIVEKIDVNPEIQTIQETYECMSTSEQNPNVIVPQMMKQSIEVTKIISQDRIQSGRFVEILYFSGGLA